MLSLSPRIRSVLTVLAALAAAAVPLVNDGLLAGLLGFVLVAFAAIGIVPPHAEVK